MTRTKSHHPRRAALLAGFALILGVVSIGLLSPASRTGAFLVRSSYDALQRWFGGADVSNAPVVIVYLDLDSYLREKQDPAEPWNRALHARLLHRLTAAGARAVVFDILFTGTGPDAGADGSFAQAIRENGRVVLAAELGHSSRNTGSAEGFQSLQLSLPAGPFLHAAAAWGIANASMDDDFVVRRQFNGLLSENQPSLAFSVFQLIAAGATNVDSNPGWLRYYGQPLSIPHVSYSSALRSDEVSDNFFRGKVVFIGARPMAGTLLERKDEFRSPLASWGDRELFMPAVEVHATQLLNLLNNDSLHRLPPATESAILFASAILTIFVLFRLRPLPATGVAFVGELSVLGIAAIALSADKIWFPWLIISAFQIPCTLAGTVLYRSLEWYRQKHLLEEQQRAHERKIREQAALIEKAQDAILVEDLHGHIVYANPSAETLYGWTSTELTHNGSARHLTESAEAQWTNARRQAIANGEWLGEMEQTDRAGRKLTVASRCTLIKDEHGAPKSLLFINTDVTEKKRLELEFLRAQRIESIGALAGGMAHDLNNALAPVLMGLQLLQKQRADEETLRMLSVMEANTHRSADMVKQVLLFSRGHSVEKEPLAVGNLLREMERIVRQTFPKSINVAVLAPADLWPILGNATQLHQILLNLCVNARDAMPHGGGLTLAADNAELGPEEAAQMPRGKPGRYVMLVVSDTGEGIAPENISRIFEPFFTTKPAGQGTGLGLSTVARVVDQHGGFVNLRSEPGRGTTFEVYLPSAAHIAAAESKTAAPSVLPAGNGEVVLVVDDEFSVREMISLGLTAQGYRVITAANGLEAIAILEKEGSHLQVVLLDTDMPAMDGRTALPLLKARAPSLPVILMSGQARQISDPTVSARLTKPFKLEDLAQTIADVLGKLSS